MARPPKHLNYVLNYNHDPDKCSIYPWAKCNDDGYAQVLVGGRRMLVHRVSFLHHGGKLTASKPNVLHHCDTPACFNPHHLYAGNQKKNALDMATRGRNTKVAKITPEQVREIRQRCKAGESLSSIGGDFGLSPSGVSRIKNGERWAWVT